MYPIEFKITESTKVKEPIPATLITVVQKIGAIVHL